MFGRLDRTQPYVLGLFRIIIGALFTCHGVATLFGVLGKHAATAGAWPGWYAAVIQLAGGALVMLGLATRPAALLSSGSMAFAYFTVHQERGLLPIQNGGEAPVFFCWAFLLIACAGPGALASHRLFAGGRDDAAAPPDGPAGVPVPRGQIGRARV
ncbi:DoxX family protein [Streptomyces montanisoli]|uniref:DoxX family protein n=1 Tax=Streptomyces montanisoli TaxID=2798581 RepID=A0A940MJG4_9ACTN|nr:DoxX family protein [Streptomyces montanisoli]MBP0461938.1 DoxX family protein [Streptomyces montanisoli]